MGYLIAAIVIILAIIVAVAVAKIVFSLIVLAAGVAAALYIWNRVKDPFQRPHPITPAEDQRDRP